jgi:hypothetical protein
VEWQLYSHIHGKIIFVIFTVVCTHSVVLRIFYSFFCGTFKATNSPIILSKLNHPSWEWVTLTLSQWGWYTLTSSKWERTALIPPEFAVNYNHPLKVDSELNSTHKILWVIYFTSSKLGVNQTHTIKVESELTYTINAGSESHLYTQSYESEFHSPHRS